MTSIQFSGHYQFVLPNNLALPNREISTNLHNSQGAQTGLMHYDPDRFTLSVRQITSDGTDTSPVNPDVDLPNVESAFSLLGEGVEGNNPSDTQALRLFSDQFQSIIQQLGQKGTFIVDGHEQEPLMIGDTHCFRAHYRPADALSVTASR